MDSRAPLGQRRPRPRIIVAGGGVCGLAAALALGRDGHDVIVLESDAAPVPASIETAWERWSRAGVAQFRRTHYPTPRGREAHEGILPDVSALLGQAGGLRLDGSG